jgi:hypothetical protein
MASGSFRGTDRFCPELGPQQPLSLNGSAFLAMFFLSTLFLQDVRGDDPLTAGLHFLPMGVTAVLGAGLSSRLVTTIGTRPVLVADVRHEEAGAAGGVVSARLPDSPAFQIGGALGLAVISTLTNSHVGPPWRPVAARPPRPSPAATTSGSPSPP